MYSKLFSRIIWACPHQFSWPRRDEHGAYYQLCVNCGSKYKYDWKHMRRTSRVENDVPNETRVSHRQPKVSWTPRERRHPHVVPVSYRLGVRGEWMTGMSENLSRSGLLFRTDSTIEEGSKIQIELEMPTEITGETDEKVLCRASVARVTHIEANGKEPESFLIACSIEDYAFGKKPLENSKTIPINQLRREAKA
jgi:hypothetical protein